jgi:dephospho-CoA kinase
VRIGLTGGIGSGKSTVGALLARCGAALIDSDAIARASTASGGAAMSAVVREFGARVQDASGAMDRSAMRALAFGDARARQRLQAIIHPIVQAQAQAQADAAIQAGAHCVVFDVPLLAEAGAHWRHVLDRVLVVDCPPGVQIERVMARNGWPETQVRQVMAAQASRAQRLAIADAVLFNGAEVALAALAQKVEALAQRFGLMILANSANRLA